ncbi:magnesium transporter [Cyanobacterium aponinum AL20118]|uniref:Magnesium transporter MgtE n=2 Tax=Cyanobacterium aponinum TaxID=379064 RepID=A0A844GSX7_9CHRO|nr:magnesium transporter [Cyanobacterium aponinum]MBD2392854.1 magnesium transporter [Cyanobacterium aponinum FACHB-4101]MTF38161.1 magnesium transporter [Cyanobacterium aponinum 0216]PHV63944.1 magnesium transporter [Cyanobacterium aponinum IPPAS B-1201]WPF88726.1 magnesium transporter [Cyanobacterium aponinum AL20115]
MSENTVTVKNDSRHELRELVSSQLQILLEQNNLEGVKALLLPVQPVDIAEAIESLPSQMQLIAFRLLNKTEAIDVYEHLDYTVQQSLIEQFKRQEVIDIVDKMSPDDRARLFDELPASVVSRILEQLSPEERQATNLILGYEEDTAGRIMTPEYISLKQNLTVEQTLEKIRSLAPNSELVYYMYVVDQSRHLVGIVSLRDLVLHEPQQTLENIMTKDVIYVKTDMDQEEVARLIQRYDLLALPVVDKELRLVGIVTVDDVIDVLEQEATEDIYALGAVSSDGDNYFQTNLFTVARRRVTWLLVLLLTNTVTGSIIGAQEDVLTQVTVLAAFIPLLIGTGGNIGTQSSTVVIRGLSTDEISDLGPAKVVFREAIAGLLLGLILGLLATIWAYLLPQTDKNIIVSLSVGISLIAISTLASISGSALPFIFRRLGLDPALMSAPFITTAVDVLGVLIYFNIARLMLGI